MINGLHVISRNGTQLGLHKMDGAFVGKLNGHNIDIYLDINSMVQKHISILAKTGGGKSYIAGVFIEELMKHDVTVMILDPHGEYHSLATKGSQGDKRFDVKPRDYKDKIVRIGTIGYQDYFDTIMGLAAFEMVMMKFGAQVDLGAGVKAAQEVFIEHLT